MVYDGIHSLLDSTQVAHKVRTASEQLERLVMGLSVSQMNIPGAVGIWSVKDVLAHVTFWENHCIQALRAVHRNEVPNLDANDQVEIYNASVVKQYFLTPLGTILARWHATREELLELLVPLDINQLNNPFYFPWSNGRSLVSLIAASTFDHEYEHYLQIQEWLLTQKV